MYIKESHLLASIDGLPTLTSASAIFLGQLAAAASRSKIQIVRKSIG